MDCGYCVAAGDVEGIRDGVFPKPHDFAQKKRKWSSNL